MLLQNAFKGLNDWWRYFIGILIVFIGYFIGQMPLYGLIYTKFASNSGLGSDELKDFELNMNFELLGINKNLGFILMILMFVFATGALWFVVQYVHQKSFKDLITSKLNIRYQKIFFGFGFWFLLAVFLEGLYFIASPENYTFSWSGGDFIVLLIISICFLPIQSSFEEFFFRGYILHGITYFSKNKWAAILGSSIFFGLVHGTNPEVAQYGFWTMQFYYILAGLFFAIVVVLDDGLELALGVHAATNIAGATLFTYKGSVLQTDALFITDEVKPWLMILGFLVSGVVFIFVCQKKYSWPGLPSLNTSVVAKNEMADLGSGLDQ